MRKQGLICLLLAVLLCVLFGGQATAATGAWGYVRDDSDVLSDSQEDALEQLGRDIAEKYQCGVYVIIIDDFTRYARSIEDCAERLYESDELGWGSQRDGILLLMSMKGRDYDLDAFGSFGNTAFTDYGKKYLAGYFLDDFRKNDWYSGFVDYYYTAADMLSAARNGEPVDVERRSEEMSPLTKLLLIVAPSLAIGFGVCGTSKAKMKTAVKKNRAEEYVVPGSVCLTVKEDRFLHRTRSVQIIDDEHNSGHGGTSVNSHGHSHSSGKF